MADNILHLQQNNNYTYIYKDVSRHINSTEMHPTFFITSLQKATKSTVFDQNTAISW
jgi:hypothetical protein